MPLPELLALYGFRTGSQSQKTESSIDDDADRSEPMEEQESSEPDPPDQPSQLQTLYDSLPEGEHDASRLLRYKYALRTLIVNVCFMLQRYLALVKKKRKITITALMRTSGERSIRLLSLLILILSVFHFHFVFVGSILRKCLVRLRAFAVLPQLSDSFL